MATYKGIDVINSVFKTSTISLSNAVKNAYAAKIQTIIDASNDATTLDASVVSQLIKLSLVRNEMVKQFDTNHTNKLDTVSELNASKSALGGILTDLKNALNYTNKVVVSSFTDDASKGSFSYQIPSVGDIQAAKIANFGANDQLNFGTTSLSDISFYEGTAGDGSMTLVVINDSSTIELTLTGVAASFDKVGQTVDSFKALFGANSIVSGGTTPIPTTSTINVSSTSTTATLTSAADTIVFAAGNYDVTLSGFAVGDKIDLPAAFLTTLNLSNTSATDGTLVLQSDDGTNVINITLTGISSTNDASIYSLDAFKSIFGATSLF
jgi:hypothetical protein